MHSAPVEKILSEYHFASDGIHRAMVVVAESIEAATSKYHDTKQVIQSDTRIGIENTTAANSPSSVDVINTPKLSEEGGEV